MVACLSRYRYVWSRRVCLAELRRSWAPAPGISDAGWQAAFASAVGLLPPLARRFKMESMTHSSATVGAVQSREKGDRSADRATLGSR